MGEYLVLRGEAGFGRWVGAWSSFLLEGIKPLPGRGLPQRKVGQRAANIPKCQVPTVEIKIQQLAVPPPRLDPDLWVICPSSNKLSSVTSFL